MSSRNEETLPASRRPKSRKSIAHLPSAEHGVSMDKENMTADIGGFSGTQKRPFPTDRAGKKLRSKSIGPGGLDALSEGTGNRRKSVTQPPPRSILKPTISPLPEIPAHGASCRASPRKLQQSSTRSLAAKSPSRNIASLNDTTTTTPFTADGSSESLPELGESLAAAETRVMLRTEEEQSAAKRVKDKDGNDAKDDLEARRDARRKSLANRRVSFAPEATLHTWDVVEYLQDSTASSAATNSTRRASSASTLADVSPHLVTPKASRSDASDPPSTPPERIEETGSASPAHQRDLHQKKRRRSSGIPPLNFNNPDEDDLSSSPGSDDSAPNSDITIDPFSGNVGDNSDSNSDSDAEDTAMSLDMDENTDVSVASGKSVSSSTGSSARLEQALELAAQQAATQGLEFDAQGSREDEEMVASFAPWPKKIHPQDHDSLQNQENIDPFSLAFKAGMPNSPRSEDEDGGMAMEMTRAVGYIMPVDRSDDDVTMDMTVAVGGIVPPLSETANRRKSTMPSRRQSTRRRSSGHNSSFGDETMDLTMNIGAIQQASVQHENSEAAKYTQDDEDMTMEFTSVIGSVLAPGNDSSNHNQQDARMAASPRLEKRRHSIESTNEQAMDITTAIGGIMPTAPGSVTYDEATVGMDMTTALGKILSGTPVAEARTQARQIMELEVDSGEPMSSPFQTHVPSSTSKSSHATQVTSATGSPGLAAFRERGLRRSAGPRPSTTPKSNKNANITSTPAKEPATPLQQITPKPARSATPGKTPPSGNRLMRTATSERFLQGKLEAGGSTPTHGTSTSVTPNRLFSTNARTGISTPSFVLPPKRRRSSGLGIDKPGLGSPHVAALLDRRESIGDSALSFSPGQFGIPSRDVHFEAPQDLELEVDKERQQEMNKEDSRKIMEREANNADDEKDATINLKEMISSLTPKKKPLRGRKSLHVGAAKGILGKRPVELDENDDEDDDNGGVKRLKNHQGSPVKNVKLKAPPSKEETTGRLTRATRRSLEATKGEMDTPTTAPSPSRDTALRTPRGQGRFKELGPQGQLSQEAVPFVEKSPLDEASLKNEDTDGYRMHLQDFLNMTSIRFMELTTTKRRHTVAPNTLSQAGMDVREPGNQVDSLLESCVIAGACTVPMLDLFQHSCRELKRYIAGGRSMVREIEAETFDENPPLFKEYMCASPDVKTLMDNQFKNVKTHARLLSKAMWYEWRMKLLDGLKEGLDKIDDGMRADEDVLRYQQELLDTVLPSLVSHHERLTAEEAELRVAAKELANCDQEELEQARLRLGSLDEDLQSKKSMIAEMQAQVNDRETLIEKSIERRKLCQEDIRAAEAIREECRGWTGNEILSLKAKVDGLERQYGWTVTGVSGTVISLSFRSELELVFDVSSFKHASSEIKPANSSISRLDLWYIADVRELNPIPKTMAKDAFLQNIREHCRCLQQAQTPVPSLLDMVSASWTRALKVNDEIACLNLTYPTTVTKLSDSCIVVSISLLLVPLATKVKFDFVISIKSAENGVDVELHPTVTVIYGERFNQDKMTDFLRSRIADTAIEDGERGDWSAAVFEMEKKLLARGQR
ncbi:MAG: hypothetical protein M1818_002905 [Claussenomyces sp. TS43310]|nr:MAG: hypothetical protein M1818_002905 [Claussenomyces sp. TS43310]